MVKLSRLTSVWSRTGLPVLGALMLLTILTEVIGRTVLGGQTLLTEPQFLISILTNLPVIAALLSLGWAITPIPSSRYTRVKHWVLYGAITFIVINSPLMAVRDNITAWYLFSWVRWAAVLGAGAGLIAGIIEARKLEAELTAERTSQRAMHLEARRDLLDYLNSLLRHEVLNTANVIDGYATLLKEEVTHSLSVEHHTYIETIQNQNQELTSVIDDVQVLLEASRNDPTFSQTNLPNIIQTEIESLRECYADARITMSADSAVFVTADPLLRRVFGNLLENALEHNTAADPVVEIEVTQTTDTVKIDISDNGPGIPAAQLDTLFDRPATDNTAHGLGMYLVDQLITRYNGSVTIVATGDSGTTVRVELPAPVEAAAEDTESAQIPAEQKTGLVDAWHDGQPSPLSSRSTPE